MAVAQATKSVKKATGAKKSAAKTSPSHPRYIEVIFHHHILNITVFWFDWVLKIVIVVIFLCRLKISKYFVIQRWYWWISARFCRWLQRLWFRWRREQDQVLMQLRNTSKNSRKLKIFRQTLRKFYTTN